MANPAKLSTEPYKGTRDFFPEDMVFRRWMFGVTERVVRSYGFHEYMGPMLEPFDLYAAKSGEELVNQQLYALMDRGDRKLAVRPEMTPTLARMVAAKLNELPQPIRWYSIPNLWRYERPQRGRLREHWQVNVDILGGDRERADVEILSCALKLFETFCAPLGGIGGRCAVHVNHRGVMDEFFTGLGLDAETTLKAVKLIDAKSKIGEEKFIAELIALGVSSQAIQKLQRFFTIKFADLGQFVSGAGYQELMQIMERLQPQVGRGELLFDPTIMRGLDYYTGIVFEMMDTHPDNRRAIFGGGRYDNLIGLFGKNQLSGVGFGMGDASLELFLRTHHCVPELKAEVDLFVAVSDPRFESPAQDLLLQCRSMGLSAISALQISGFSQQLKLAAKHNARYVILFGESEWAQGQVVVKRFKDGQQTAVALNDLETFFKGERDANPKI